MKKIPLIPLLFMLAFVLPGLAEEYRVACKVTAPDMKNVLLCDGEKFYPVRPDGSCDFAFKTDCEPFAYILYPDDLRLKGNRSFALVPGENRIAFTLEKCPSVPGKFTFILGSDIQYDFLKKGEELENDMAEIRDIMKEHGCEFITFPGDLTEFGEPAHPSAYRFFGIYETRISSGYSLSGYYSSDFAENNDNKSTHSGQHPRYWKSLLPRTMT